jgi:hypothetical protein
MKHVLIILNIIIYSVIIFACASLRKEERIEFKNNNIVIFNQEKYIKQNISNLIKKAYFIKTGNIYKPDSNHQTYIDMIYLGSEYFGIDYKNIIAIITIESEWNPLAYNCNRNYITSEDYGLCQINTQHLESNYNCAKKICDKYKISYTNSYYDIKLNILSAFIYLNDTRTELYNLGDFSKYRWITSYNCGVRGSILYKESAEIYWNKFINIRSQL